MKKFLVVFLSFIMCFSVYVRCIIPAHAYTPSSDLWKIQPDSSLESALDGCATVPDQTLAGNTPVTLYFKISCYDPTANEFHRIYIYGDDDCSLSLSNGRYSFTGRFILSRRNFVRGNTFQYDLTTSCSELPASRLMYFDNPLNPTCSNSATEILYKSGSSYRYISFTWVQAPPDTTDDISLSDLGIITPDPATEITGGILSQVRGIAQRIVSLPGTIVDGITSGLMSLKDALSGVLNSIKDTVSGIPSQIGDMLEDFFIPEDGFIQDKFEETKEKIEYKFQFIAQLTATWDEVLERLNAVDAVAPQFNLTFRGREIVFIDFSIFNPYMADIRAIILAVCWIAFIIRTYKRLPGLLHGMPDMGNIDASTKGDSKNDS